MTHYYLYIKAGSQLDAGTRFYKVGVGESETQTKKRAWLQAYANENGHFFVRWSMEAVEFLRKCLESLNMDMFEVSTISSAGLVAILRDGHAEPSSLNAELNRHNLLMQIDAHYSYYHTLRNKHQKAISRQATSK